jgi:hypothetical protein
MRHLTLKLVNPRPDETSLSYRSQMLAMLGQALNSGKTIPQLVQDINEWTASDPLSYRSTLIDLVTGNDPLPVTETKARLRLLDVLEPAQDGELIALEDADHAKLCEIVEAARIPVKREWLRFVEDVKAGEDALPQITAEAVAEEAPLMDHPEHSGNGRVLHAVGAN